ncbi:MAG: hypothetical protein HHJ11_11050 [Phycicoccus sp.]|nr:hypothetical protein [Phycicoccus sp.]NMM33147.1 hypothetical protein [Phycicoccus sp.]
MPGQHGTSLKDYTQALIIQLRLRDVPGRTIGQVVAEVESHVRETGEDPVEVFGQPGSYSAQFAGRRRPVGRGGWLTLDDVTFPMFMIGALVMLNGVLNLGESVDVTAGVVSWAALFVIYALVVVRIDIAVADRETRTITTARRAHRRRAASWLRFLALFATFTLGRVISSRLPHAPVFVSLPGWSLVLVGLVVAAVSIWAYQRWSDQIVDPRPWHLKGRPKWR